MGASQGKGKRKERIVARIARHSSAGDRAQAPMSGTTEPAGRASPAELAPAAYDSGPENRQPDDASVSSVSAAASSRHRLPSPPRIVSGAEIESVEPLEDDDSSAVGESNSSTRCMSAPSTPTYSQQRHGRRPLGKFHSGSLGSSWNHAGSAEAFSPGPVNLLNPSPRPVAQSGVLTTSKSSDGRKVVNGYVKVRRLGQGSYAKVVLYHHEGRDENYAIKVVSRSALARRNVGSGSTALANQLREIEILKQLDHPNVVRLEEVIDDPDEDRLYIVLEWLQEGPVMEEDGAPLPESEAREVLLQVAEGLAHLHAEGVVHGDIKPGNLLRGRDGRVRIVDFGASSVPPGGVDEIVSRSPGTPAFTAPECCVGEPYSGRKADIWALGTTLFMLLTGAPPFTGINLLDTYEAIQTKELDIPEWLEPSGAADLLRRMLDKDPNRRASLEEVLQHPWAKAEPVAETDSVGGAAAADGGSERSSLCLDDMAVTVSRGR